MSIDEAGKIDDLAVPRSARNLRDIAGTGAGYPTTDGGRMRRGVVYRSNELLLDAADASVVAGLGIRTIYDLRSPAAIVRYPDTAVDGARMIPLSVQGIGTTGLRETSSASDAADLMHRTYIEFVTSPDSRASFGDLLRGLASSEGPELFHCTAGKDRTGWASALLQLVAGADEAAVRTDYLLTNERRPEPADKYLRRIVADPDVLGADVYAPAMLVSEAYLESGFDQMRREYGDLDGYLGDGLGVERRVVEELRSRLRVP